MGYSSVLKAKLVLVGSVLGGLTAARAVSSLIATNSAHSSLLLPLIIGTLLFSPAMKVAFTDFGSTRPSTIGTGLLLSLPYSVMSVPMADVGMLRRQSVVTQPEQVIPAAVSEMSMPLVALVSAL